MNWYIIILELLIIGIILWPKTTGIIVGIVLLILTVTLLGLYLSDLRLKRKLKYRKNTYPNAYKFFLREAHIFKSEDSLSEEDIKKILSSPKTEWEKREEQELKRIQQIKWERAQATFSTLCRSKKSATPHSGCYHYNIHIPEINYNGDVWHFFFSGFCTATDLDYIFFEWIARNNIYIEEYRDGKIESPFCWRKEICSFIKALNVPVQIITFDTNLQVQILTHDLAMIGFQSSAIHHVNELPSNYVVIIDGATTQLELAERCKFVIKKFEHQKPCIVYISLMKGFSRKEMQQLIDIKFAEIQRLLEQKKDETNTLKSADIETAKEKTQKIKNTVQSSNIDKEPVAVINETDEIAKNNHETKKIQKRQHEQTKNEIKPISNSLTPADIETEKGKAQKTKNTAQSPNVDKEPVAVINETDEKVKNELDSKENTEIRQHEQIKNEIKSISNALKSADIETAKEKVLKIKNFAQSPNIDKELISVINETEEKVKNDYATGIIDNFKTQYVDYFIPSSVQDKENWKYPVTKYPENGCIVFPYRRKNIARRGFSEPGFQKYLEDVFKECDLLILGDCNILPVEDNRPFEPDIAIISKKYPSIRIDIEIDEPYAPITRKPIHYKGCGDDFRDACLNNIGWIVIRFTEYQVFTYPKECAAFIAQVLHCIQPSVVLPSNFLLCSTPKNIERWTEIEAKVMASENARENYLNHKFGIVDNKELEVADIKQTEKEKSCAQNVKPLVFPYCKKVNYNAAEPMFRERDTHIQFYPQEHIYLYNGHEQLIPVSSVISCFFKPFDSLYWSEYKANQRQVSQGQILEEWDAKGTCSRDVGTFMHQQIENYYKGLPYQQEFSFKYKGKYVQIEEQIKLESEYLQFMDFLENHQFKPFRTEWAIYDEKLKIAGTIDMIHKRGEVFDIYDWKRSLRIVDSMGNPITINDYGEKGLGELNKINDTPYWHYCIQQNLYRYILEKNYDIKVEKMYLVVFCDDTYQYNKLDVPYMDEAVNSIVKACNNGTVKKRLISLRGENLS